MKYEYLTKERAIILEKSIGFLSDLTPSNDVIHVITDSNKEDINVEKTNLLHELQIINRRRKEIIKDLTNEK